ncbi:MAG: hypothetical protein R2685_11995 [Candidatus Nitrosocosmicus sp.]|nr:hypothetical protein [Candidatus Nitrosocosmicus sp.]
MWTKLRKALIKIKEHISFHLPMRLFTFCKTDKQKFFVASHAKIRSQLPPTFFLTCPYNHTESYFPNEIYAETSEGNVAVGGALAGGLIGLIAGGVGSIAGAILGGLLGGGREKQDIESVNQFNNST